MLFRLMTEKLRKYPGVLCVLVSSIMVLFLLLTVLLTVPARAADELELILSPTEGEIGGKVRIQGTGFEAGGYVYLYFSSDAASIGNFIDSKVTHYELLERNVETGDETSIFSGEFRTS